MLKIHNIGYIVDPELSSNYSEIMVAKMPGQVVKFSANSLYIVDKIFLV